MKIRLALIALALTSISRASEPVVGMEESALIAEKGSPQGKIVAGRKTIYRYRDMVVTVVEAKVSAVEKRDLTKEAKEAQRVADLNAQAAAKKQAAETAKTVATATAPAVTPAPVAEATKAPVTDSVQGLGFSKALALTNATSQLPASAKTVGDPVYVLRKDNAGTRSEWRCTLQFEVKAGTPIPGPQF